MSSEAPADELWTLIEEIEATDLQPYKKEFASLLGFKLIEQRGLGVSRAVEVATDRAQDWNPKS